jgi:hypothetical protein
VANSNGIFMTYLDTSPDVGANIWRLARSTDGGQTFTTVYQGSDLTRAPAMETDENNNIYLGYTTYATSMHFARFSATTGYTAPDLVQTYNGVQCASKYAMAYDRPRQQFYIATQYGQVLTVDKSGNLLRNQQVFTTHVGNSSTQYPNLFVDSVGVLHRAETTADVNSYIPYETIRYLKSTDGGNTWQSMGGAAITIPTSPEPTGPSTMINLVDEVIRKTWLSSMYFKSGKAHFAYHTYNPANPGQLGNPPAIAERQHYMRFDGSTGGREIDSWTSWGQWGCTNLAIWAQDGLFASDLANPSGPLYFVGTTASGNLAAIISLDNGTNWQDYATAPSGLGLSSIYSVGGSRGLTPDGKVIGSFTAVRNGTQRTYFYSFKGYVAP